MLPWTSRPTHLAWLEQHTRDLLDFGRAGLVAPGGGAAYLDDDGRPDPSQGVQAWITCRTVHVYSLGAMLGVLRPGTPEGKPIDTVLVNGCECEPYLTADERLMIEARQGL